MNKRKAPKNAPAADLDPNSRATVSGPAHPAAREDSLDDQTAKMAGTGMLASAFPFNTGEAAEYGQAPNGDPPVGQSD
jgi:hypothetical protein